MESTQLFQQLKDHFLTGKQIKIALAGNPNCGKSTLFNALTGLHQKTGNYPGVTVDRKTGNFKALNATSKKEASFKLIDLPGTYSLFPKSPDEQVSFNVLMNRAHEDYPDLILIVTDASNIKRHLLLATELIDLGRPCMLVLNMMDAAIKNGIHINKEKLSELLHIPVAGCNARQQEGIEELKQKLFSFAAERQPQPPVVNLSAIVNKNFIESVHRFAGQTSPYASLLKQRVYAGEKKNIEGFNKKFYAAFESRDMLFRFEKIKKITLECIEYSGAGKSLQTTDRLDDVITHPFWGFVIFTGILFLVFQSIFYLAEFPMQWIEQGFSFIHNLLKEKLPDNFLGRLFTDGILQGLSGIVVFVPQIALLFGFISLLEDSGYMARVSFIMDKLMRKVGLNGRSVIPLISGMACAVPAIMSTRTIANKKERLSTILITPLMSCSARLPVYTLLIGIIVPAQSRVGFFNLQGLILTALYLLGIVASVGVAAVLKYLLKTKERSYFMMELPVYRFPQPRTVALTMLDKVKVFLLDAGKVIMLISVVLWLLTTYGPGEEMKLVETQYEQQLAGKLTKAQKQELLLLKESQQLEHSYAGHIGKVIEPVIKPLGFDWKIGISLISSFIAREVFVGTMATIYGSHEKENELSIREKMVLEKDPQTGKAVYGFAVCMSLLVFYAFAMQCMSTLAIVKRETNSWKWPVIQFAYMSVLAYVSSLLVFQWLK